jgi:hypothetical protein
MMCNNISVIRLFVKYIFIINLFRDTNININFSILNQTSKEFDSLKSKMSVYFGTEGIFHR